MASWKGQTSTEPPFCRTLGIPPEGSSPGTLSPAHRLPSPVLNTDFTQRLQKALDADFQIDRELGGGGMSRVFLATERALQRKVVIKVLPPELAAGVNIERFKREIQLAAQLQHPHVVPLLATGDEDGILWFSMPFIEGESLRGALTRQKRLPPRDVVRILHDVVDALAYSHARGIVHRDIKPDNILTSGMHALVTDFGVAKALSAAIPMAGGTTTGMVVGTPAYMAPEQLAADPAADHRVDIYAVGLLAYELLTGRSPFGGSSPQATMAAQLTEMPKPPHEFADIPEGLSALIMHCLEKDSAKRPQSAQALLAELDALPPLSVSGSTGAARVSNRRWVGMAAALLVVAATFVVAQYMRQTPRMATAADSLSPRDAGPGGDRGNAMQVAKNATPTGALARPETIVVYRTSGDSSSGIQVPVVISRAESLAIVDAFRKRIAAGDAAKTAQNASPLSPTSPPTIPAAPNAPAASSAALPAGAAPTSATSIGALTPGAKTQTQTRVLVTSEGQMITLDREQLLAEVGKIFADSVSRALKGMDTALARASRIYSYQMTRPTQGRAITPMLAPPSDGRMRVVVTNFTNTTSKREYAALGRDVAHFVRAALPSEKFDVVDDSTTDRARRTMQDPMSMGWGLRADFLVHGMVTVRADSVVLITVFTDLRDGRFTRTAESAALASTPQKAYDISLAHVNAWLDTAKVIRSRRPQMPGGPIGFDGRGGNTGRGGDTRTGDGRSGDGRSGFQREQGTRPPGVPER